MKKEDYIVLKQNCLSVSEENIDETYGVNVQIEESDDEVKIHN